MRSSLRSKCLHCTLCDCRYDPNGQHDKACHWYLEGAASSGVSIVHEMGSTWSELPFGQMSASCYWAGCPSGAPMSQYSLASHLALMTLCMCEACCQQYAARSTCFTHADVVRTIIYSGAILHLPCFQSTLAASLTVAGGVLGAHAFRAAHSSLCPFPHAAFCASLEEYLANLHPVHLQQRIPGICTISPYAAEV